MEGFEDQNKELVVDARVQCQPVEVSCDQSSKEDKLFDNRIMNGNKETRVIIEGRK